MIQHTCGQCGLHSEPINNNAQCGIFGHTVHLDGNACSEFNPNPYSCDLCHRIIIKGEIIEVAADGSVAHIVCEECSSKSGTCYRCASGKTCSFNDDPSPLPKMVKKQIRQRNMTAVVDVPNPERTRFTCEKGCPCFNPEFGCLKQSTQMCGNYKEESL